MALDDWDFDLPPERIARRPAERRTDARLMVVPLPTGSPRDARISDLPELLRDGDLLVANDSRVMRARLGARRATGGAVELLLLGAGPGEIEALARPARKLRVGDRLSVDGGSQVEIVGAAVDGIVRVRFDEAPEAVMARAGRLPLPPYLERDADAEDDVRYQTVFADALGSSAAPTAGLHLDRELLATLAARGAGFATVTLHVGLGTFRPLRDEDVAQGELHPEVWTVPSATAEAVAETRARGGRVIAVGTTSARALQSATPTGATLPVAGSGTTRLFLRPPDRPTAFDGLLTNFHLPRSSLLMLVATLCGRERLLAAYADALLAGYRFYSYGDAMLLLPEAPRP
ncbi:MAG: tRNA preQ1(34) S-adenosylmethionine ribosyltransferase-isomerase QueA [Alphaproteobacteria bacterium]|nr:tRNA preQ1(34) S-adenosylmethionine ribosyltransferase-isomerase QueA [Alphaproteobacteria bacterium]MCB9696383.1 tRNA preQ1(34) S-adenosylmethionine ribosyltransferase-isomerase QueA [Alphaproteobacteria bacterium]